jgi:hypothetical protein
MLAKVVKSRPLLLLSRAIGTETLVGFAESMRRRYLVHTFAVPFEVIYCTEAFFFSAAIRLIALKRLVMAGDMFPTRN